MNTIGTDRTDREMADFLWAALWELNDREELGSNEYRRRLLGQNDPDSPLPDDRSGEHEYLQEGPDSQVPFYADVARRLLERARGAR